MASDDDTPDILVEPLARALGDRFLLYAVSTIVSRALPDARDGLKPVQRRILWGMRELGLTATSPFRKCAKIAGDVMGNYHPHGQDAIYDALARMAQGFTMRVALVQGQGNFGNIDGDAPAAMRYTEARSTEAALSLLAGLDEDAVDFRETYDGTGREPEVLPAAFPNLLVNGAQGIAVGMATNIPPHNPGEVIAAARAMIAGQAPHLPGPDVPTGGLLVEPPDSIAEAYRTGRGGFRLRARWGREDLPRGQWQIVVTEIPYQVPKSRLIEKLAELVTSKKVPILADVRDESAEDVRIVLEPKARTVDPDVLMETLFRLSDLETRVPLNLNVLIDGRTPKVSSLTDVLRAFLDHRRVVLRRRTEHRLARIAHRLEVLEGYIVAFLNLDRVIEIIRSEDEPKPALIAEDWGGGVTLTEVQAEAILNMRLRSLRRLEEMELRQERDDLTAEQADLTGLLGDEGRQWDTIDGQLADVAAVLTDPRRTEIGMAAEVEDVPLEAMVEREPVTVVCSQLGWIRAMRGHLPLDQELKYRDGDGPAHVFHAETTDRLLLLSSTGRMFTLAASTLPGGRGQGEPVRLMVDLPQEAGIAALRVHRPGGKLLLASSAGDGFVAPEDELVAQTRAGRQVLNLKDATARVCRPVAGDHVAVIGDNAKLLVFPLSELPEMARGKGVRLQRYKDGGLSDAVTLVLADGLRWPTPDGKTRHVPDLTEWLGKRATSGRMRPRGFPRDSRFPS